MKRLWERWALYRRRRRAIRAGALFERAIAQAQASRMVDFAVVLRVGEQWPGYMHIRGEGEALQHMLGEAMAKVVAERWQRGELGHTQVGTPVMN